MLSLIKKAKKLIVESPGWKAETSGQAVPWGLDTSRVYDPYLDNFYTS